MYYLLFLSVVAAQYVHVGADDSETHAEIETCSAPALSLYLSAPTALDTITATSSEQALPSARLGISTLQRDHSTFTRNALVENVSFSSVPLSSEALVNNVLLAGKVSADAALDTRRVARDVLIYIAIAIGGFILGVTFQRVWLKLFPDQGAGDDKTATVAEPLSSAKASTEPYHPSVSQREEKSDSEGARHSSDGESESPEYPEATDSAFLYGHSMTQSAAVQAVRGVKKSHSELVFDLWMRFAALPQPDLFRLKQVRIAEDGGMSDIEKLQVRTLRPLFTIGVLLANLVLVTYTDLSVLNSDSQETKSDFLFTAWIVASIHPTEFSPGKCVPFFELICLWGMVVQLVIYIGAAKFAHIFSTDAERGECISWTFVADIFWQRIPGLTSFSALQLLHFVSPEVISSDGHLAYLHALQRYEGREKGGPNITNKIFFVLPLVSFGLLRLVALLFGIDAFLIKFRKASQCIDEGKQGLEALVNSLAFIWQIMGIIQLRWFVSDRLFIFIFAAEDGSLDFDEIAVRDVWKAILCKKVFKHFKGFTGARVMLGFNDYDFQRLVFEDNEKHIRSAATLHEPT